MLKLTGYYSADYLPECNQKKTMENVITYIKTLEGYIAKTFIVLVSTAYQGEWQYWGKRFSDLYMSMLLFQVEHSKIGGQNTVGQS